MQRFTALSDLYGQLGFRRKSSFFRRVSAMRSVAPQTSMQPNWSLCYTLLLDSLPGYRLSLDPTLLSPGLTSKQSYSMSSKSTEEVHGLTALPFPVFLLLPRRV